MNEKQIKHMADRFLGWRLPEDFSPDNGISFKKTFNEIGSPPMTHEPTGTDLFDATQALAMVRYLVEGLPIADKEEPNPEWEAKADAYHAAAVAEAGVQPVATLAMMDQWKAHAEPANSLGKISFSRALLDSATDALRMALEIGRHEHQRADTAEAALAAANARVARLESAMEVVAGLLDRRLFMSDSLREDRIWAVTTLGAALAETPASREDTP